MSKLKFESSDFHDAMHGYSVVAKTAQAKFDKWLSEQPVVYGKPELGQRFWVQMLETGGTFVDSSHQARLVNIEELKPKGCEHEFDLLSTKEPVIGQGLVSECCKCGIKLRATWGPA